MFVYSTVCFCIISFSTILSSKYYYQYFRGGYSLNCLVGAGAALFLDHKKKMIFHTIFHKSYLKSKTAFIKLSSFVFRLSLYRLQNIPCLSESSVGEFVRRAPIDRRYTLARNIADLPVMHQSLAKK